MTPTLPDLTREQLDHVLTLDFGRFIKCAVTEGRAEQGLELFQMRHPRCLALQAKASVSPGTINEPAWAAPLAVLKPAREAVIRRAHAKTILGQLSGARRVPFNASGAFQASGGTYTWVGEGAPKPVGNLQLQSVSLPPTKAAGIIVISDELAKLGEESDAIVRDDFERGLVEYLDQQFIDPAVAAGAANPASILNTANSIGSAGTSAANALTDAKALLAAFFAANPDPSAAHWIMSPRTASALAIASNSSTLTVQGGTFLGLPAVVSVSAGARLAVVDAGQLLVAADDDFSIDVSKQASIELNTTATSPVTASTVLVSLWQQNLTGLKVARWINWKLKPSAAVYSIVSYV